jgi:hypothetical protein
VYAASSFEPEDVWAITSSASCAFMGSEQDDHLVGDIVGLVECVVDL